MKKPQLTWILLALVGGCAHSAPEAVEPAAPPPAPAPAPPRAVDESKDELQVQGTLGTLADEEVSGPFQRRWDDITNCYQQAQAKLWYLGGKIEVHVKVGKTGEPKTAYVSSSTFGNWDAERCVVGIARQLTFSKPHGGSEAEFSYPIEFRSRSAIVTWDEARVAPSLVRHKSDVAQCKVKSQNRLPQALTMTLYVAPGGKVTSTGFAADAPVDDQLAACLVAKTRGWRLDDPLGKIAKATVGVRD
jgi:hypothetical protein